MTFARAIGVVGSLVFPGIGVGLSSSLVRASVWAVAGAASLLLIVTSVWWLPVTVAVRIASAWDAWRLRSRPTASFEPSAAAFMLGVVGGLLAAPRLDAYVIPTDSMVPTIEVGDHVYARTNRAAPRDEVIVFRQPCSGMVFVKRAIGLPGDRIVLRSGVLWRNGRVVDLRGGRDFPDPGKPFLAGCGPSSKQPIGTVSAAGEFVVPMGGVFVMGDNRAAANDSRYWGVIPTSAIIGTVIGVYWPPSHAGDL